MEQHNKDVPAPDFGNMEPVAWYLPSPQGDDSIFRDHQTVVACTGNKWEGFLPLYVAPPKDSTKRVAEPIGWLEAPHGTFRRNHSVSVTFPPQTVDWKIPVFLGTPARAEEEGT
jgi:hypothetical protein